MFRERILRNGWGAIPNHDPLKVGSLAGILNSVAAHLDISRDELIQRLFG
jgi:hypothetical protein